MYHKVSMVLHHALLVVRIVGYVSGTILAFRIGSFVSEARLHITLLD
jgi:hypothetical protein